MTLLQKRIYELLTYDQLAPNEVDYEDPSSIWMTLDKSDWSEPMKIPFSLLLSLYHIETASIIPTSQSVSVTYQTPFDNSSYFFNSLQVYKIVTIPSVGDVRQTVAYHDLVTTVNGFSFTLSQYSAGIIVTFFAAEPSLSSAIVKDYIYTTGSVANLVVPNSDKVQITGLSSSLGSGITLASNQFTVRRAGIYDIQFSGSVLNETASNVLTLGVYSEVPTLLGTIGQFVPRNDYDTIGCGGLFSLAEDAIVRFYLAAAGTGETLDLSTIAIKIKQL